MSWTPDARALHARIERHLAHIAALGGGGGYVTYIIKDPCGGDPYDLTDGTPFYVGQTSDLGRRARQHLRRGGSRETGGDHVAPRIYAILAAGKLPIFDVVERTATRLASLESEARWARALTSLGYDLANRWKEHRTEPTAQQKGFTAATSVKVGRLWCFTLEEAADDGVVLEIACPRCRLRLPLPIDEIAARSRQTLTLSAIRAVLTCPKCGHKPCLRLGLGCQVFRVRS